LTEHDLLAVFSDPSLLATKYRLRGADLIVLVAVRGQDNGVFSWGEVRARMLDVRDGRLLWSTFCKMDISNVLAVPRVTFVDSGPTDYPKLPSVFLPRTLPPPTRDAAVFAVLSMLWKINGKDGDLPLNQRNLMMDQWAFVDRG